MPYALSFSERFFLPDDPEQITCSDKPTSVYAALLKMRQETWDRMAREVFDSDPDRLDLLFVLDRIRETNTCSNLDSPVQVWIDPDGWYDVLVYDVDEERDNTVRSWQSVVE